MMASAPPSEEGRSAWQGTGRGKRRRGATWVAAATSIWSPASYACAAAADGGPHAPARRHTTADGKQTTTAALPLAARRDGGQRRRQQPFWGCGLLGDLPGIDADGVARGDTRTLIDGLKATNLKDDGGKVTYWNWNFAPGGDQVLTEDFVFFPSNWGVDPIPPNERCGGNECLHRAGETPFLDGDGRACPATMGDILLGANEPDILGSCMGDVMGSCTGPCTSDEVVRGDCPVGHLKPANDSSSSAAANSRGRCDCWTDSHATGVGFWNLPAAPSVYQPLPTCWEHPDCIDLVMGNWREIAAKAVERGYKYLSAPMVAVSTDWMRSFVEHACDDDRGPGTGCSEMSCGCPTHVAWHFYANDCQPERPGGGGGYRHFQDKLDATVALMEEYPHLQGAVVNEVGMLNCAMDAPDAICVPNGPDQTYPANEQPNHACPSTSDLPDGLATFVERLLRMASESRTSDGRRAVVGFTWFNENMAGGTYNLRLFDDGGDLNALGRRYIKSCREWADGTTTTLRDEPPPPYSPPRGSDKDPLVQHYATHSILFFLAVLSLSALFCCCCGIFWASKCAKRRRHRLGGGLPSVPRGHRADQKARGRFVPIRATEKAGVGRAAEHDGDGDDDGKEHGIALGGAVFGGGTDPTSEHIGGGSDTGSLELVRMDGEAATVSKSVA